LETVREGTKKTLECNAMIRQGEQNITPRGNFEENNQVVNQGFRIQVTTTATGTVTVTIAKHQIQLKEHGSEGEAKRETRIAE
jgi:hypothetical protein